MTPALERVVPDDRVPMRPWPAGHDVAVSLTFDVDAEFGYVGDSAAYESRLSSLSDGRFGIRRGIERVLALLREHQVPATFYVTGRAAELYPSALEAILDDGHEVGHHGYLHLRPYLTDSATQRAEIERGLEALERVGQLRPDGYRAPGWELTPTTLALLGEYAFRYDSSCMEDDEPYAMSVGAHQLIELPVHWTLDDWPYFGFRLDDGGRLASVDQVFDVWVDELRGAIEDRGHVTYTMHPEVIGRRSRLPLLRRLLESIDAHGNAWYATHAQLVGHLAEPPRT